MKRKSEYNSGKRRKSQPKNQQLNEIEDRSICLDLLHGMYNVEKCVVKGKGGGGKKMRMIIHCLCITKENVVVISVHTNFK